MRTLAKALATTVVLSMIHVTPLNAQFRQISDRRASKRGGDAAPTQADWDRVIANDREMVASGFIAPEDVDIDIAMSKLAPEVAEIRVSRDPAKKEALQQKVMALMTRKGEVDSRWLAAHPARDNGGSPDPCLSAAGKNICGSAPPPSQPMCSMNYGDTVGLVPC